VGATGSPRFGTSRSTICSHDGRRAVANHSAFTAYRVAAVRARRAGAGGVVDWRTERLHLRRSLHHRVERARALDRRRAVVATLRTIVLAEGLGKRRLS